jgi:hypothetical protein
LQSNKSTAPLAITSKHWWQSIPCVPTLHGTASLFFPNQINRSTHPRDRFQRKCIVSVCLAAWHDLKSDHCICKPQQRVN